MYPNPYACYAAKASEVNGLVSSKSKYGATTSHSRSDSAYSTREMQKGKERKRSGVLFILFCLTALITIIVFVVDSQPKHVDIKATSLDSTSTIPLEQSTELLSTDSESSTKSADDESDARTEEYRRDAAEQANKSLSKFKDLAGNIMTLSSEDISNTPSLSTLQMAIQPTVSWGTNWTQFLPPGVLNPNIGPKSKITCGSPGDRSIDCCMDVLCGAFLAKSICNKVTESNMTLALKCMKYGNGSFTNCFKNIPAAMPLMNCMACNSCIEKPADLNCSESDSIDFSKFVLQ